MELTALLPMLVENLFLVAKGDFFLIYKELDLVKEPWRLNIALGQYEISFLFPSYIFLIPKNIIYTELQKKCVIDWITFC